MCGIAGWFGGEFRCDAEALLSRIRHRGPDGEGVWIQADQAAGLVHTRLAILDPTDAGRQPMVCHGTVDSDGESWIVFNGEIFNFRELRRELEEDGENFGGGSDTEVLLRLLARDGERVLPRLAGMFAFAWYDARSRRALLARDAFGIKPLYYTERNGSLAFASEVRALRPLLQDAATSPESLRDLLLWGTIPEPATVVEGIVQLPAGSALEWTDGKVTVHRWHNVQFETTSPVRDAVSLTRSALRESVQRHLVSDVPVGVFLSGGIDSTAVLALTRDVLGSKADIRTFSIGFEDPEYDESAIARRTAEHFGARHTEWRMTAQEGRAEIQGYMDAMDQPTIDGFNTWCVSRLSRREGVKVVLSGLGGDEMFAGYGSFRQVPRFLRAYAALGSSRFIAGAALDLSPAGSRWRRLGAFLRGSGTAVSAFHAQRGIFTEAESAELTRSITGQEPGPVEWSTGVLPENSRDAVSFMEITLYMRNQLLRDSDVFSMAHGLELRVPFVDARLFATLSAIPASTRLRDGKRLLLDAVPEVPEWVRNQPKRGFRFPFQDWVSDGFGGSLSIAAERTTVPLVTWYRQWALAVAILKG